MHMRLSGRGGIRELVHIQNSDVNFPGPLASSREEPRVCSTLGADPNADFATYLKILGQDF